MSLLRIRNLHAAYGERPLLRGLDLDLPPLGITLLLGPVAAGKSTLLRLLAGNASPKLHTRGEVLYAGLPLHQAPQRPALVEQRPKTLISTVLAAVVQDLPERGQLTPRQQRDLTARILDRANLPSLRDALDTCVLDLPLPLQRALAIIRATLENPACLCVDEPTAGVEPDDADVILDLLLTEAQRRSVLVVTHHQGHARRLGGTTILLGGGRSLEQRPTPDFFATPHTRPARDFVRTGSCDAPPTDTPAPTPPPSDPPPPPTHTTDAPPSALGPRGFQWLWPGRLAGTPRPGIIRDLDDDLHALARVGVDVLVNLTEYPLPQDALAHADLTCIHSPIIDMHPPSIPQALELCDQLHTHLAQGRTVAIHCKAGLGRTGTLLAAMLIHQGHTSEHALQHVRSIQPRWVQSDSQEAFLHQYQKAQRSTAHQTLSVQPISHK